MGRGRELRQNSTVEVETVEKSDAHEAEHLTTAKGATCKNEARIQKVSPKKINQ